MRPDSVVIDIDGCLSDCSARRHLVQGPKRDYAAFHARLGEDPVNEWCLWMVNRFNEKYDVFLVSARPESCMNTTWDWLYKHGADYSEIVLLRPDNDSTPAAELKRRWAVQYGPERILFAVDDDSRVAAMWRSLGVTCLQCSADDRLPVWTTPRINMEAA